MAEETTTSTASIADDVTTLLKTCKTSLNDLGSAATAFLSKYDSYTYSKVKDATIIKNKLKNMIASVMDSDL